MVRSRKPFIFLASFGMMSLVIFFSFAPMGAIASTPAAPAVAWPQVTLQRFATGTIPNPSVMANTRDGTGRMVVASQNGIFYVIQNGAVLATPYLDISSKVASNITVNDNGVGGLVFDPNFGVSGLFYVAYISRNNTYVVERYSVTGGTNVVNPNTAVTILTIPIPAAYSGESAGHLAFGINDGDLYIGTGAAGAGDPSGLGQNMTSLLGKILRIDVNSANCVTNPPKTPKNYCIPAGNPFASSATAAPEIWASGLRNPWMFTFDTATGNMYIGDVGENSMEEVDFQPAASAGGMNYGWNILEGTNCFNPPSGCVPPAGYVAPVVTYTHALNNCAVIGGYVYHGGASPAMQGIYLYADLCSGRIFGAQQSAGTWSTAQLGQAPFMISSFGLTSSFDVAPNLPSEVLVSDYANGVIYRLVGTPGSGTPAPTTTRQPSPTPTVQPTVGGTSLQIFLPAVER